MPRITFCLACLIIGCAIAPAQSHYATYLNDFAPLLDKALSTHNCKASIDDNRLLISNDFSEDIIIADTMTRTMGKFKFYARLANLNNREHRSYKYTDLNDHKTKSISDPVHGIVWGYTDDQNFYAAMLQSGSTNASDDIMGSRYLTVSIISVINGNTTVIKEVKMEEDGVDTECGYNVVNVEYDGNTTAIAVGNRELRYIAQIDGITYPPMQQYGILAGPASHLAVERTVLRTQPIMQQMLSTQWTDKQSLEQYFKKSHDVCEGFWTYFDKDLDERKLKLGGRYTVALVKNGNGYDIIYVDGAQVNNSEWKCGMLKGRITETQFIDNYSLVWYDATMRPFSNDVYATIENYSLLTLNFTAQKSTLRFARER